MSPYASRPGQPERVFVPPLFHQTAAAESELVQRSSSRKSTRINAVKTSYFQIRERDDPDGFRDFSSSTVFEQLEQMDEKDEKTRLVISIVPVRGTGVSGNEWGGDPDADLMEAAKRAMQVVNCYLSNAADEVFVETLDVVDIPQSNGQVNNTRKNNNYNVHQLGSDGLASAAESKEGCLLGEHSRSADEWFQTSEHNSSRSWTRVLIVEPHLYVSSGSYDWVYSVPVDDVGDTSEDAWVASAYMHQFFRMDNEQGTRAFIDGFTHTLLYASFNSRFELQVCENADCLMNNVDSTTEAATLGSLVMLCPSCLRVVQLRGFFDDVVEVLRKLEKLLATWQPNTVRITKDRNRIQEWLKAAAVAAATAGKDKLKHATSGGGGGGGAVSGRANAASSAAASGTSAGARASDNVSTGAAAGVDGATLGTDAGGARASDVATSGAGATTAPAAAAKDDAPVGNAAAENDNASEDSAHPIGFKRSQVLDPTVTTGAASLNNIEDSSIDQKGAAVDSDWVEKWSKTKKKPYWYLKSDKSKTTWTCPVAATKPVNPIAALKPQIAVHKANKAAGSDDSDASTKETGAPAGVSNIPSPSILLQRTSEAERRIIAEQELAHAKTIHQKEVEAFQRKLSDASKRFGEQFGEQKAVFEAVEASHRQDRANTERHRNALESELRGTIAQLKVQLEVSRAKEKDALDQVVQLTTVSVYNVETGHDETRRISTQQVLENRAQFKERAPKIAKKQQANTTATLLNVKVERDAAEKKAAEAIDDAEDQQDTTQAMITHSERQTNAIARLVNLAEKAGADPTEIKTAKVIR